MKRHIDKIDKSVGVTRSLGPWRRLLRRAAAGALTLLALLIFLGASALPAPAAKTYLVCVGLNVYDNGENPLPCSRSDARGIGHYFHNYNNSEVFMLLDKNATREHILSVLKKQFAKARPEDEVIFAYSGHGFDGGISCYDTKNVIYSSEIQEIMRECKAKRKIMFMNACHSGSFRQKSKDSRKHNYRSQDSDVMLFLSSRANEYSWENSGMKYSYFFNRLLAALSGYADADDDKCVTARELFNYVYGGVLKDTNNQQHPQMYGKFPDDMVVVCLD